MKPHYDDVWLVAGLAGRQLVPNWKVMARTGDCDDKLVTLAVGATSRVALAAAAEVATWPLTEMQAAEIEAHRQEELLEELLRPLVEAEFLTQEQRASVARCEPLGWRAVLAEIGDPRGALPGWTFEPALGWVRQVQRDGDQPFQWICTVMRIEIADLATVGWELVIQREPDDEGPGVEAWRWCPDPALSVIPARLGMAIVDAWVAELAGVAAGGGQ